MSLSKIANFIKKSSNELYHVTKFKSALNIMKHDYFRRSKGTIGLYGLSTTTDKNYWWGSEEVRFVINKKKIGRDYKLQDVDEGLGVNESEVKVLSNKAIMNAHKYIDRIEYFSSNKEPSFENELNKYTKKHNLKSKRL